MTFLNLTLFVSAMRGFNKLCLKDFKDQGYNLFKVIDLPVVFSRPDIPFDRNRILRSDSFAILLHLKEIT